MGKRSREKDDKEEKRKSKRSKPEKDRDSKKKSRKDKPEHTKKPHSPSPQPDRSQPQTQSNVIGPALPPSMQQTEKPTTSSPPRKKLGAMTPGEYAKQQKQYRQVFDEDTGRVRLVRGTGEIVERIVSREEQERIRKSASMWVAPNLSQHTGKAAFPTQHPWFGYS
eukprot:c42109_g1_i1.p1 GENE.c42109_g1_i1~~c42109_g1_i1.p1  ORF type:complete len:166 (+),score=34.25 c42109_g1_i1:49-546(+)